MKRLQVQIGDRLRANIWAHTKKMHYNQAICAAMIRKSESTYKRKLKAPETFTIKELNLLAKGLETTIQDLIS